MHSRARLVKTSPPPPHFVFPILNQLNPVHILLTPRFYDLSTLVSQNASSLQIAVLISLRILYNKPILSFLNQACVISHNPSLSCDTV